MIGGYERPPSTGESRAIQDRLLDQVVRRDELIQVRRVAGLDVGFTEGGTETRAAVAVLSFPDLQFLESSSTRRRTVFPYMPGLLSFREAPALLGALAGLSEPPHLLLCDGQVSANPRRCGLACHLAVLPGLPSTGAAKSRLIGEHEPLGPEKGDWMPLWHQGEIIGALVRTRRNVQPLYVSVGHKISLETAVRYVLACTTRFRLPETTRWAHRLASLE